MNSSPRWVMWRKSGCSGHRRVSPKVRLQLLSKLWKSCGGPGSAALGDGGHSGNSGKFNERPAKLSRRCASSHSATLAALFAKHPARTVYFGNASLKATEKFLLRLFRSAGPLKGFVLWHNRDGASLGQGLVQFATTASARRAHELDGSLLHDQHLRVRAYRLPAAAHPHP
mmetsp:Transcript_168696/g.542105  ORF Transcript_168696/g.542105 Transcript_168696/m.542105 type:complete len:171 (+) Transcript_168696:809-1321(+)